MTSTLPPIVQAFSGALGSASANILVYPLDLVTTRVQLDQHGSHRPKGIRRAIAILRHIFIKKGITAFYDGIWTDTGATLLSSFFYFYFYSFLRSLSTRRLIAFRKPPPKLPAHKPNILEDLILGFIAGVASRVLSTPLNIITLHLQSGDEEDEFETRKRSVTGVVKHIYHEQGLPGFWRGFQTATLLSLNPSITLAFFQFFRRILRLSRSRGGTSAAGPAQRDPSPQEAFVGAAVSNSIAVTLLYPLILAKTRLQASSATSLRAVIMDAYRGASAAQRTKAEETVGVDVRAGISGLYQGLEMQILKGFLGQGVTFLVKGRIEQAIIDVYIRRRGRHSVWPSTFRSTA